MEKGIWLAIRNWCASTSKATLITSRLFIETILNACLF